MLRTPAPRTLLRSFLPALPPLHRPPPGASGARLGLAVLLAAALAPWAGAARVASWTRPGSLPQSAALVAVVDLDGDGVDELVEVAPHQHAVRLVATQGLLGPREFAFPVAARVLHVTTLDWDGDGVREIGLVTEAGVLVHALDGRPVAAFLAPLERGVLVPFREPGVPGERLLALVEAPQADEALLLLLDGLGTRAVLARLAPGAAVRVEGGAPAREIARLRFQRGGTFGLGPAPAVADELAPAPESAWAVLVVPPLAGTARAAAAPPLAPAAAPGTWGAPELATRRR